MDIREYVPGDQRMKDLGAQEVVAASVVFAIRLVEIVRENIDSLPDDIVAGLGEAVDAFMAGAAEFMDMDALMEAFGER